MKNRDKRNSKGKNHSITVVEALEPRVLFSADVFGGAVDTVSDDPLATLLENTAQSAIQQSVATAASAANDDQLLQPGEQEVEAGFISTAEFLPRELILVDANTPDYQQLVDDIYGQGGDNRQLEIVVLDPNRDGIAQISEILEGQSKLDSVHLIAHASEGSISLGSSTLDFETLRLNAGEIGAWGNAFTEEGDFLIYGCNLAATGEGQALVDALANITGTDVAASDDLTGHASLGGDWDMEYRVGEVTTRIALSDAIQSTWSGTLDITSNLVGHYAFEEGSGTTATDSSATGNDGSLLDVPIYSTGVVGDHALDFYGDFDRVEAPDVAATDFGSGDFTVSFWFNSAQSGYRGELVADLVGNGDGYVFWTMGNGDLYLDIFSGPSETYLTATNVFDGNWHHVSGVRSGDTFSLYVDDALVDSTTQNSIGSVSNNTSLYIGAVDATGGDYDGLIDDVRLYDRALASSDITELYSLADDDPIISNLDNDVLNYTEGDGAAVIEQGGDALVSDPDSSDFAGGDLIVEIDGGGVPAEDVLSVRNQGISAGQIGLSGSDVTYEGVVIGTLAGGTAGAPLEIVFNGNATPSVVTALLLNITYENTGVDNPTAGTRSVTIDITDGDGGMSGTQNVSINVTAVNDQAVADLNGADGGGIDFATTFTEGVGAVNITDSDAILSDPDHTTYQDLGINLDGGFVDGSAEKVTIAGYTFSYGVFDNTIRTVGGTNFEIDFDGTGFTIAEELGGYMPEADLQLLLRGITYENTSDNPTAGDRTIDVTVQDAGGQIGVTSISTITVVAANDEPTITNLGGDALAYTEGDGAVVIEQSSNAAVNDVDSSDFDMGTLTVSFVAGSDSAEDVLAIRDQGAGPTNITISGNTVSYDGTQIGTFTGGSGGTDLVITLDADADATAVSALVQNITYENTDSDSPSEGARTVRFVLTDGDGGSSANYDTTVTVTGDNDAPTDIVIDAEATSEQVVNTYTTSDQIDPAVAAFDDGGYIVVWVSNGQDGSGYGIYGQRYYADGSTNGGELLVTSELSDSETNPSVTTFSDGGFVVAWQDQTSGVMAWAEARVFNADGSAATAEFQVSPGVDGDNEGYQPAVLALSDTEFVVVWANETGGTTYEVVGQIYDRTGSTVGSQFSVGSLLGSGGLFGAQTEITKLDDGGFAVAWRTNDGTLSTATRVLNADGTVRSAVINPGGDNIADISSLSNGGFVVTYDDAGALNATIYDSNGALVVAEFQVNTTSSTARYESTVTRSDDGFVVVWESSSGDGSGSAILAQRFDLSGNKIGSEVVVNETFSGSQKKPEIIETTSGQLIIVWESENVDGDLTGIASRAIATGTASVAESAPNGTRVADVIGVFDPDSGDTHTYSLINSAGGAFSIDTNTGVITVADTTQIDFESASTMDITVRATDTGGLTYDEVLTIQIIDDDDPAVITGDTNYVGNEGDAVAGDLNATDEDGLTDGTYFTISAQSTHGIASIDAETGAWSFTPSDPDWFGTDQFKVTVTDDQGGTTDQIISITVNASGDDLMVAVNDSYSTDQETPLVLDPTANDTDVQGDTISVVEFNQPANGTVEDNGDGTLTYTPNASYTGADGFDYIAIDKGSGLQHHWGLDGDAVDAIGSADGTLTGTSTVEGDFGNGLSFNESSDYVLLPDVIYNSEFTVSFEFKIDDNDGSLFQYLYSHGDVNAVNSINIFLNEASHGTDPNVMRTVVRDGDDTLDNAALQFDISSIVGDGQWHTYTVTVGAEGIQVFLDGVLQTSDATRGTGGVDPSGNLYLGARQDLDAGRWYGGVLDSVQIYDNALDASQVSDLAAKSNVGTVNLMINVDDPAVISGDTSYVGNEGDLVSGDLDATDVDGLTDLTYFTIKTQAGNGVASIDPESGAWSFTPADPNWFGSDQFTVTVTDDEGGTTDQVVSITLANVEDEAVISGDIAFNGNEGDLVSGDLDATDVDGLTDSSYFTIKTQAGNGVASIDAESGAWSFTPADPDWFGTDQFTVTVTDDEGGTTDQIISVTLANVEDEAVISGDTSYVGNEGDLVSGDLDATDVDGLTDSSYFTIKTQAGNGVASIDAESGAWSFTPADPDWFGTDQFTVTVTDDEGGTTDQIISVTLANVEDEAVISGDIAFNGNEGDLVSGDLDATDVDGLTDSSYFTIKTQAGNGVASIDPESGAWSFTPADPNWFGSDQFTVTVTDDEGGTTDQVVSITLANVEDEAVISGDIAFNGNEGDLVSGDLDATDVDGLTDSSYFTIKTQAGNGVASIDPESGAWSFTPADPNWFGSDQFTVTVTDDEGGTTDQVVSITLANVEDEAVISGDIAFNGNEGDLVSGDLDATDVDGLTDSSYFTIKTQAGNGVASIDAESGAWSFTPADPDWFGTDQFTVTVTDDEGGTTDQIISVTLANVEDEAVISGDTSYVGNEGDLVSGDLDATDVDGLTDSSYFTIKTQAGNGVASIDAESGAWSFTPADPDWFGTDQFTVTVTDDEGGTTDQIISVTLANVEDEAVISGDIAFNGNEGDLVSGDLDATDVDGLTDSSYFTIKTQAGNGVASIDPESGAWSFTPADPNWFGSDQFTVTVTDDEGGTTDQVVSITLANVEDEAVISGDIAFNGNEGDLVSGDLDATDVDGLTDSSYFTIKTQAGNGVASIDPESGAWSFTPADPNWFGSDQFTVTVTDDEGGTTDQVVSITLANVEDEAVISGDTSYVGNEGDLVSGDLDATDVDGLTDSTYFTIKTQAGNGVASIDAESGAWSFTPADPDWFGTDQFTVTVTDDEGGTTDQIISVTLANVEDEAVISGDIAFNGNEGDLVSGDLDATDVDGLTDGTYFTISAQSTHGVASIDPESGAWSFTPADPDWFGTDQFTVTVTDDEGGTTDQVVSITLANVEDEAVISGDIAFNGNEGDLVSGDLDATDVDGLTDGTYFTISAQSTHGVASIDPESGAWSFTPADPDWFGTDQFTVTVTDDEGGTTDQIISVTLANVEDEAVISGDIAFNGNEGDLVSGDLDATDVDGLTDSSYFTIKTQAGNGVASIDPESGAWSFTPADPDWFGTDQFTVTVTDDEGGTTDQIISVTLANVEDEAVISGDTSYVGNEGDLVSGDLNATDVDGLTDSTYFTIKTQAGNGVASIDPESGAWSFTPADPNWFGSDQFTVTVTDDEGGTTDQIISVTLANVEDEAVISGDIAFNGNEGDLVSGDLDATDVDGLTDSSYFTIKTQAGNGVASIDPESGAWSFTPADPNWFGSDQFTVTVTDDEGGTTDQVVSITLANVEDEAVISGDTSYVGNEGDLVSGDLNATDVDGLTDSTYFTIKTQAGNGVASIDPESGAWSFTPADPNWFGSDQFTVTVTDDEGGTTDQIISVTLANVEDEAVISGDIAFNGNEGDLVSGDLDATDVDGLTDSSYFTIKTQAGNGVASIDPESGAWSFTPADPNWFGSDQFTVTVTDDEGGTTDQVVSITLANVEDEAVISGDTSYVGNEGDLVSGDLDATDVDGLTDSSYFTIKTQAGNGVASIDAESGAWSFTPADPDWFGTDQFTVTVTDDEGGTTDQIISVTLANVEDEAVISGDIAFNGNEGDLVSGDLDATDVDGLTDGTYFTISAQSTHGVASIDPESGAWSFTPADPDWFGTDQFTVTVTDDEGGTTDQVVSITLANVEDEAVISGDIAFNGNEGDLVSGDLDATDVDGLTDGTYFTISAQSTHGVASIDPESGAWSFTPADPDWFGTDQFTVTVTDDEGGTTDQIISVTLANVEDEAVISGDIAFNGNEGDLVSGDLDATDVDGLTDSSYFTIKTQAGNGVASIDPESGAWSFTPADPNWFGSDQFTVTVTDDEGGTTDQVVSITLANVEDEAVISGDTSYVGNEGDLVSGDLDATDVDGLTDSSYFTIKTQAGNGVASIDAESGAWSFTPADPDWFGTDQFTVTVTDDEGGTTDQIISVTLANVEDEAVISGDIAFNGNEGDLVSGDLDATDVDGLTDSSYFTIKTQAGNGVASIDAESGAWSFTPADPNWFGSDQFTVTVTDDEGGTTDQVVSITLANVEDEAVISGDIAFNGNEGDLVSGDLDATDVDGLTDSSYFTIKTQAGNGVASIDAESGAWSFIPADPDWFGSDQFTVTVTDDEGGTTDQIISVTLANVNDPAVISGDSTVVLVEDMDPDRDSLLEGGGILQVFDPDRGESSFKAVTVSGSYGVLVIDSEGSWFYAANNNQSVIQQLDAGEIITESITLRTVDGTPQEITVTIKGVKDVPETSEKLAGPDTDPEIGQYNNREEGETAVDLELEIAVQAEITEEIETAESKNHSHTPTQGLETADIPSFRHALQPMDGALIASVISDSPTGIDHSAYRDMEHTQVPPKSIDLRNLSITSLSSLEKAELTTVSVMENDLFMRDLDKMNRDLEQALDKERTDYRLGTETVAGLVMSLSAGFVSWVLRGGSLLAGFMSMLPLWKQIDPLPILGASVVKAQKHRVKQEQEPHDQNQIEEIFQSEDTVDRER